jgi:hypothetical protein
MSPMSHSKALHILIKTSILTVSPFDNFVIVAQLTPDAVVDLSFSYLYQLKFSKAFYS